jgi:hypothetical protein
MDPSAPTYSATGSYIHFLQLFKWLTLKVKKTKDLTRLKNCGVAELANASVVHS